MLRDCPACGGSGETDNGSPCPNGCPIPAIPEGVTPERYYSDEVEEARENEAELVRYTCTGCGDEIIQDAEDTLIVDLDANPVCSTDCQAKANHAVEVRRELRAAEQKYADLDEQAERVKQWHKDHAAALARLVELAGVGHHFEADNGVRYIVDPRKGAWVDFTPFEMKHSKRFEADTHTFTMIRQEELGYPVEKRGKKKETAKNE